MIKCNHWDQSCHLGNPKDWKTCQERMREIEGPELECTELKFGWKHYPGSPWGDVDICPHGVMKPHGTNKIKCRWCDNAEV